MCRYGGGFLGRCSRWGFFPISQNTFPTHINHAYTYTIHSYTHRHRITRIQTYASNIFQCCAIYRALGYCAVAPQSTHSVRKNQPTERSRNASFQSSEQWKEGTHAHMTLSLSCLFLVPSFLSLTSSSSSSSTSSSSSCRSSEFVRHGHTTRTFRPSPVMVKQN